MQLVLHQSGELAQAHFHDGSALYFAEVEAFHQSSDGFGRSLGGADDGDDFVDIVAGDDESFQDVCTLFGLAQVELCAAHHHFVAMFYEVADEVLQVQCLGALLSGASHQCHVVHAEAGLQGGHLEQFVQHHTGVGIALHVDDDAHTFAVRFVVGIADAFDFLLVHQVGNALDEFGLVHAVGYFGHHNLVVVLSGLDFGFGSHDDASPACFVGFAHTCHTIYISSCGEVGSLDMLHQFVDGDVVVVDIGHAGVNHLAQVVGGHVGGHTYGDTAGTVHQQVGYAGGHHGGLLQRVVEVVGEIYGLLVEVLHHVFANLLQACLGVTHGGSRVAVHRTEVTLTIHEGITHGPVLCHTHQGAIHGRVAVGMVLTQHVTHGTGRFLIGFVRSIAQFHHAVEDTAVYGLQSVSHIWEGTGHDDRHGVVDVRRLHLLFDVNFYNSVLFKHLV